MVEKPTLKNDALPICKLGVAANSRAALRNVDANLPINSGEKQPKEIIISHVGLSICLNMKF